MGFESTKQLSNKEQSLKVCIETSQEEAQNNQLKFHCSSIKIPTFTPLESGLTDMPGQTNLPSPLEVVIKLAEKSSHQAGALQDAVTKSLGNWRKLQRIIIQNVRTNKSEKTPNNLNAFQMSYIQNEINKHLACLKKQAPN